MKKTIFWIVVALLIAGGGLWVGVKTYQKALAEAQNNRKKTPAAAAPIAIEAVRPVLRDMRDRRVFSGSLKAWSSYDVAPKISGRLRALPVDIGDAVAPGALIARIDDSEYRQAVAQVQADLDVAVAQQREAEVILQLRQQEFDRQKTLIEKQIGSQAQFESAQSSLLSQKATLAMKEAEVKRAAAALETARIKLGDTTISAEWSEHRAPRYVGERYVDVGALLQVNQPIVNIAEIDRLRAAIYVIERDYPFLKLDQPASITTDAYPDEVFAARVSRISQVLQENSRQAYVLLEIPNADLKLKPGMFVRVELEFARHENATVVPRSALIKRNGKNGLFRLAAAEGKAYFTEVETGIVDGDAIEIRSPRIDLPVITLGNHLLSHGSAVIVPPEFAVRDDSAQTRQVKP